MDYGDIILKYVDFINSYNGMPSCLVTEFCNGGTLEEYRKGQQGEQLSEQDIQFIFRKLIKGY